MISRSLPVVVLAASSCLWGIAWVPLKALGAAGVTGVALVLVSCGTAGALLLPRFLAEHAQWRGDPRALLAIAVLGGYSNLSFTVATLYGDIVRVMVLFYLLPAWGALGGRIFLGERLDRRRIVTVAMALAGAWLVLGGLATLRGAVHWTDVVAITCGMAFAGNTLVVRARQALPVASKTAVMVLAGAAMAAVLLLAGQQPWPTAAPAAWAGAVGYGAGWLCFATLATQFGVTHLEAGRASIIIILELVLAVATAVWLGGERMSPAELAGGLLILVAAVIEARRDD